MGLQVGRLVGDEPVAEGVALGERVVGEALDDVEQPGAEVAAVARRLAAVDELGPLLGHQLADLLAARLAQVVGVGQRVAGEALAHAHHRLLVDHQPVGVGQDLLGVRVDVADVLPSVLAVRVVVVHVARPSARAGTARGRRPRRRSRSGPASAGAGRIGPDSSWNTPMVSPRPSSSYTPASSRGMPSMSKSGSFVDRTSSTVSVMTSRLRSPRKSILSRPRSSTPCISYWVTIGASAGGLARLGLALDGQVGGQRLLGDDDGGGVDAVLAAQALQPERHVDHLLDVGVGAVHGPQVGRRLVPVGEAGMLLEAVLQRGVPAHDQRRHGLGHAVADGVRDGRAPAAASRTAARALMVE